ncbi:uncharacterized protein LOC120532272 [Polypterus senegalus]|uniref:uncharacterized protein LOC120532272 n=1 Tax=Polypterus senegalus TaxID=55291 RepID=UPI0019626DD4|nr:uncharacterized protein LOC120532272 [Polypterus senegalus]
MDFRGVLTILKVTRFPSAGRRTPASTRGFRFLLCLPAFFSALALAAVLRVRKRAAVHLSRGQGGSRRAADALRRHSERPRTGTLTVRGECRALERRQERRRSRVRYPSPSLMTQLCLSFITTCWLTRLKSGLLFKNGAFRPINRPGSRLHGPSNQNEAKTRKGRREAETQNRCPISASVSPLAEVQSRVSCLFCPFVCHSFVFVFLLFMMCLVLCVYLLMSHQGAGPPVNHCQEPPSYPL